MKHLAEQTIIDAVESMNLPKPIIKRLQFKIEELETALNLCLTIEGGHERNINQVKAELVWEFHQLYVGYANTDMFVHAELCHELIIYIAEMN